MDENVPRPLRRFLSRYDVATVADKGRGGIKNGSLLRPIEKERFDVFLTGDKKLRQTAEYDWQACRSGGKVCDQPPGDQNAHRCSLANA